MASSNPIDVAYLKQHGFPTIVDDMLNSVLAEKPSDPLSFCIEYLEELRRKQKWVLQPHPTIPKATKPVVVCILDGWGETTVKDEYNAVHTAKTPTYDRLMSTEGRARTVLAHGPAVGLPSEDDMGNSEVGHNALGSGQIVDQGAKLVDNAIQDGSIFRSDGWEHLKPCFEKNTLHLIGLLTKGGVHARMDQLLALISNAAAQGAKRIRLHLLTDGRDVVDGTSEEYTDELTEFCEKIKDSDVQIASGGGRMHVTMDRYEADWAIVERGWKAHVLGEAPYKFPNMKEAVAAFKKLEGKQSSDQFFEPFVCVDADGKPKGTIEDGDSVCIFNFRADRMIQLSKAFEYDDFSSFDRVRKPNVRFCGMMQYDGDLKLPSNYLVPAPSITNVSGEYLCANGVRTFAVSETQKFGHVTFFWNGNRSGYINGELETYFEEPSDKVVFDEKPDMKAREVTAIAMEAVKSGRYDMIRVNYANPDMVGHTGNLPATIQACETVDTCLGELLKEVEAVGGRWLVTADHGNADDMVQREKKTLAPQKDADGALIPCKSHTLAPVPVCIGGDIPPSLKFKPESAFSRPPGLANITATYINLLGLAAPGIYQDSLV
eukprot:TRINITY_DN1750_c0_g1_i1.p1 TRINITY_DN1750_c0_g1~~TRINITY_DN1750_c0_g1_i1.p1  ORF type:complete len:603 (+),score=249.25 TRINITY_DN1750_c0_g1_i1:38-1846(+)